MEDYQRGELDLGRFKDESSILRPQLRRQRRPASAIMSHDDLQYYYYVYMQGLYIFFPQHDGSLQRRHRRRKKSFPSLTNRRQNFAQLAGSGS